nr:MAG TPA: hypothetical protein [Caudoviricetes sp.]
MYSYLFHRNLRNYIYQFLLRQPLNYQIQKQLPFQQVIFRLIFQYMVRHMRLTYILLYGVVLSHQLSNQYAFHRHRMWHILLDLQKVL